MVTQRPADRYGTAPRTNRRPLAYLIGAIVVIAGLGVAYLGYRQYGPQDIEPDRIGYNVVSDSEVTLDFKLTRSDPEQSVVCFVRALNGDNLEVGRREVLIPGSDEKTVRVNTIIRTTARAGAANTYGCSHNVPAYLRVG